MSLFAKRILVGAALFATVNCAASQPKTDGTVTSRSAEKTGPQDTQPAAASAQNDAATAAANRGLGGDLAVTTWSGKSTTVKALAGPVTLFFLWSSDCKSCLHKLTQLQALAKRSEPDDSLRIVLVNTDPPSRLAVAKQLTEPLSLSLPMVVDDRHQLRCRLRQLFGAEFFPHAAEAGPRIDVVPQPLLTVLGPGDKIWGEISNNDSQTDSAFIADKQYLISLAKRGELPEKKPALHVRGEASLDNGLQLVFPTMTDEQIDQELPKVEAQILQAYPRLPMPQRQRMLHQAVDTMRRGGRILLVP